MSEVVFTGFRAGRRLKKHCPQKYCQKKHGPEKRR